MTARVGFSTIGKEVTVRFQLEDLSGRDKINLLDDLLMVLELKEKLWNNKAVIQVLEECYEKHW